MLQYTETDLHCMRTTVLIVLFYAFTGPYKENVGAFCYKLYPVVYCSR